MERHERERRDDRERGDAPRDAIASCCRHVSIRRRYRRDSLRASALDRKHRDARLTNIAEPQLDVAFETSLEERAQSRRRISRKLAKIDVLPKHRRDHVSECLTGKW